MSRKKWTPKTEVNDQVLQLREKRKWQIALRRYILEGSKCSYYAPYFGLPAEVMRKWIEIQFRDNLTWDNFSSDWQFEHVLPVSYFDFRNDIDLRLCWNFVNIRVESIDKSNETIARTDVLSAKHYFRSLFQQTNYWVCQQMLEKIEQIESTPIPQISVLEGFLAENKELLTATKDFSSEDFIRLNTGMTFQSLVYEKEFLKKHGS